MPKVVKKDNTIERFNAEKIQSAVKKAAFRCDKVIDADHLNQIADEVYSRVEHREQVTVAELHEMVIAVLAFLQYKEVADAYAEYRYYKQTYAKTFEQLRQDADDVLRLGDRENANFDSSLVSTKGSLIKGYLTKSLYKQFYLSGKEKELIERGDIYIHDLRDMILGCINCCLFDIGNVLKGGFEMSNVQYTEPKTVLSALQVIGDVTLVATAQQFGGFTLAELDKVLLPYVLKSEKAAIEKYMELGLDETKAEEVASKDVIRELEQGFQSLELKLNTVPCSRGDFAFTTITFGQWDPAKYDEREKSWLYMIGKIMLQVRRNGHGKDGKPVVFPKLVFLYDDNQVKADPFSSELFNEAVKTSAECMYPDYLSLSSRYGSVSQIFQKYGAITSPMGCRAFLSPWFERGGMEPADENDKPVFVGRFNIGAVSLHLPLILAKSRKEGRDFYEVLDYYLELIRRLHIRTYAYLGEMRASTNPLAYCEGGFYGGHLGLYDKIKPLLKTATASFGYTALNELQELYNGKSIYEDGQFALDVMQHINEKVNQFKKEDGNLYAIYGTPAESLCGLQIEQFRNLYGIVENVSDRPYVSNSFHCHVTEDITPIEKQNSEARFWNLSNGGKIQYVRYPVSYNKEAIRTLVRRAMKLGLYEGVNLSLAYCDDCGYQQLEMDVCPKCGSKNLTKIDRMNGYLSYSRVHGESRLNDAKMAEIAERKSM